MAVKLKIMIQNLNIETDILLTTISFLQNFRMVSMTSKVMMERDSSSSSLSREPMVKWKVKIAGTTMVVGLITEIGSSNNNLNRMEEEEVDLAAEAVVIIKEVGEEEGGGGITAGAGAVVDAMVEEEDSDHFKISKYKAMYM